MLTTLILSAAMALQANPVDIPKDGELPILVFAGDGPVLKPLDRFGAKAWVSWTDEGLVAKVQVTDLTPMVSASPDRLYEGDSVELFLKHGEDMVQIVAAPGSEPKINLFDYRSAAMRQTGKVSGTAGGSKTDKGYVMNLFLPWSNLGIKPTEGMVVGARIGVNDAAPGEARTTLRWLGNGLAYDFNTPAPVRLARTAASLPTARAWLGVTEHLDKVCVNVLADASMVGRGVECRVSGSTIAHARLKAEAGIATARIRFGAPETLDGMTVAVDGKPFEVALPDLPAERRAAFMRQGRPLGWNEPRFDRETFSLPAFPTIDYKDRKPIERLVGPVKIETAYYDAASSPVRRAEKPGRYGAVATVSSKVGTYTVYRTLFRSDGKIHDPDAVAAAAQFEGRAINPQKADRDYWHALRKKLGTAIHYEWFAKTPEDYDASKPWPLIVYLHGSGGGDAASWDTVKVADGPMGVAYAEKGFPFIVVSLRSPGGWYPPAVQDAIDEVSAKYAIDKDRVYLTGFSMGGMGTWQVAYDRPDRFAAIAPVGARSGDAKLMPLLAQVPAWVFNGADDTTCSPAEAREAVAHLEKVGDEVRYTEIPNAGHVESLRFAYAQKELYEWFLRHKREG